MKKGISLALAVTLTLSQASMASAASYNYGPKNVWDKAVNWGENAFKDVKEFGQDAYKWGDRAFDDATEWGKGAIEDIEEFGEKAYNWGDNAIDDVEKFGKKAYKWSGNALEDTGKFLVKVGTSIYDWSAGAVEDVEQVLDKLMEDDPELTELDLLPVLNLEMSEFDNVYSGKNYDFEYIENVKTKQFPKHVSELLYKELRDIGISDYWSKWVVREVETAGSSTPGEMIAEKLPMSMLYGDKVAKVIDEVIQSNTLEDINPLEGGIHPADDVEGMKLKYKPSYVEDGTHLVVVTGLKYGRRDNMFVTVKAGGEEYKAQKKALNGKEVAFIAQVKDLSNLEVEFKNEFTSPPDISFEIADGLQDAINGLSPGSPISNKARDDIKKAVDSIAIVTENKKTDKNGNEKTEVNKVSLNDTLCDGDVGVILTQAIYKIPVLGQIIEPIMYVSGGDDKLAEIIRDVVDQVEVKSYAELTKDMKIRVKKYDSVEKMNQEVVDNMTKAYKPAGELIDLKEYNLEFDVPTNFDFEPENQNASDWALNEIKEAYKNKVFKSYNLFNDYKRNITREEFATLVVDLFESYTRKKMNVASDSTFTDTKNEKILKAYEYKIIGGKGDGIFAPDEEVTREQMAIMITKCIDAIYRELNMNFNMGDSNLTVADKAEVADWSKNYVAFANRNSIINGSNNMFNPKGKATVEQAVMIVGRTYKKYEKEIGIKRFAIKNVGENKTYTDMFVRRGKFEDDLGVLKMTHDSEDLEATAVALDSTSQTPPLFGDGVYETTISFNEESGNAGFVFSALNVHGEHDERLGYYVGIDSVSNQVLIGKHLEGWNQIDGKPLGFDVVEGRDYKLKVAKSGTRMDVYVNNKKYISTSDPYFRSEGLFGPSGWDSDVSIKELKHTKHFGSTPVPKSFIAYTGKNFGNRYTKFATFGGDWENAEKLKVSPNSDSKGPMAIMLTDENKGVVAAYGKYNAEITILEDKGNAGIVFNVMDADTGNDKYVGYYVGIDPKKNTVILGSSINKWDNIRTVDAGKDIKVGQKYHLHVDYAKEHGAIFVRLDGKLLIGGCRTDIFKGKPGVFGVRTYDTTAEFKYVSGPEYK